MWVDLKRKHACDSFISPLLIIKYSMMLSPLCTVSHRLQNSAAWIFDWSQKTTSHPSWLPCTGCCFGIDFFFKNLLITYEALRGLASSYLRNLLSEILERVLSGSSKVFINTQRRWSSRTLDWPAWEDHGGELRLVFQISLKNSLF